jgi:hypothetical protein
MLLQEIRAQGYSGGIGQRKTLIHPSRPTKLDPVVRFEAVAGK